MKTTELLNELIKYFKQITNTNSNNISNQKYTTAILKKATDKFDLKLLDTNGLPFNGTTYEIFRYFEYNGHKLKETIGHFKYVSEIYADKTYCCFYDDSCVGGHALNGIESGKYIARIIMRRD